MVATNISDPSDRSKSWLYPKELVRCVRPPLAPEGPVPTVGLIAATGDVHLGKQGWFLHTDGPYFSSDGGETLNRVVNHSGPR